MLRVCSNTSKHAILFIYFKILYPTLFEHLEGIHAYYFVKSCDVTCVSGKHKENVGANL